MATLPLSTTSTPAAESSGVDFTVFEASGGWCWFQDPRALLDDEWLVFGSVDGVSGDVRVTSHHLATGKTSSFTVYDELQTDWDRNDHLTPALLRRKDGRFLVVYSRHGRDRWSRWRVSEPNDPTRWSEERRHDVIDGQTDTGEREDTTYSNLYRMDGGRVIYNFHRGRGFDANFQITRDEGDTWEFGGRLFNTGDSRQRPYLRYAGDGRDTVHFSTTEAHPRNYANSIYHGFIRDGRVHRSDGSEVGPLHRDHTTGWNPVDFTLVYQGGPENVAWTSDIRLDPEGRPRLTFSVTKDPVLHGGEGMDQRFHFARWDGERWREREIAYAGTRLYHGENEYTGLATLDPVNPNRLYIATNAHPVTGEPILVNGERRRELFQGDTADDGESWRWTPLTRNSPVDNLRPVAVTGGGRTALLWMRGEYRRFLEYETQIVGFFTDAETP